MTSDDWKYAEENLRLPFPYGQVDFIIDGFKIEVVTVEEKPLHYVPMVYVNGKINGEWLKNDSDIAKRFYCRHTKNLLNSAQKRRLKRERKAVREAILKDCIYEYYLPYFTSFRTLKSHFIKNNNSIELIKE